MKDSNGEQAPAQEVNVMALSDDIKLYHSTDNEPFATIDTGGYRKVFLLRSKDFQDHIKADYRKKFGKFLNAKVFQDFMNLLEYKAKEESPQRQLFKRIAATDDAIYVDLNDDQWRVVKITKTGWKALRRTQVHFVRTNGSRPLPYPVKSKSSIEAFKILKEFLNTNSNGYVLIIGWIIGCFLIKGPFPLLVIQGEAGSGKSTVAEFLKDLIDPSKAPLRTLPKNEQDLMISAKNGWVLVFDNLSKIQRWLSDAFCRLSTGGGLSTRKLYLDSDEILFDAVRPLILNGIEQIVTQEDLADRALVVEMKNIPEDQRKPKEFIVNKLEESKPLILGAIFTAVSMALRNREKIKLDSYPRMADFLHFIVAAEPAVFATEGKFLHAMQNNSRDIGLICIDTDPVAAAISKLLKGNNGKWRGTSGELLRCLENNLSEERKELILKDKSWPKAPNSLSLRLKELAPTLRKANINIVKAPRSAKKKLWKITSVKRK